MNKIFILIISGLTLCPTTEQAGQELSYSQIGELYLNSFTSIADADDALKSPDDNKVDFKSEPHMSDRELRALAFTAFASSKEHDNERKTVYYDLETVAKDLNLFFYESKDQDANTYSLFSKINNTVTVFGEVALAKKLANPLTKIADLNKRQNFIRLLLKNQELFEKLNNAINMPTESQSGLLYFWKDVDALEAEKINSLFFKTDSLFQALNKSSFGQEATTRLNQLTKAIIISLPLILFGGAVLSGRKAAATSKEDLNKGIGLSLACVGLGTCSVKSAIILPGYLYQTLPLIIEDLHKVNYIHKKLICAAQVLQVAETLQSLLVNNSIAINALSIDLAAKDRGPSDSPDFNTLLSLLRTDTFKGDPSFFSWTGRVKAAYFLMQEHKDTFTKFIKYIGEIDSYLSIAKLYKKHHETKNHYSFATFAGKDAPYIQAQQFWNPMLNTDVAVANNLELDVDGKGRIAIVTGSNSAGKSTIMINGLTSTLWLAQTLCIAPAKHLTITPFACIATAMNVQDSVLAGESHFVAQVKKAADLKNIVKKLPWDKKIFMAIDELFDGATPSVGSKALHDFGKSLAEYKNLIAVICTQYQKDPTLLEQETNGICKNYKVDVVRNADGTITRPYLVEEGVSQVSIGAQLLEEAFDTQDEEPNVTDDQFDGDQDQD